MRSAALRLTPQAIPVFDQPVQRSRFERREYFHRPLIPPRIMDMERLSDHYLERYYLGMVKDPPELEELDSHLLICQDCVGRSE
jgi:hypothetical protein